MAEAPPPRLSYARGASVPPVAFSNLAEKFQQSFLENGPRTALILWEKRYTYSELWEKICRLSSYLSAVLKLQPHESICVCLPNDLDFVVTIHAALRSGLVSALVSPTTAQDKIVSMLEQTTVSAVFLGPCAGGFPLERFAADIRFVLYTDNALNGTTPALFPGMKFVGLKYAYDNPEAVAGYPKVGLEVTKGSKLRDACAVVFSSGSTGKPKGIQLTHASITGTVEVLSPKFNVLLIRAGGLPISAPLSWGFGLHTLFLNHFHGGAAKVIDVSNLDMNKMLEFYNRENCLSFVSVASFAIALLQGNKFATSCPKSLYMFLGAEPCPIETVVPLARKHNVLCLQTYGMTEMQCPFRVSLPEYIQKTYFAKMCFLIYAMIVLFFPSLRRWGILSNLWYPAMRKNWLAMCGKIGPGHEMKIVDDDNKIVPIGCVGELCVRGACCMKGYLRDTDQFYDSDGWGRSGDLAVLHGDGFVQIVGRKKEMIVRGGVNIYPREVEQVFEKHPAVGVAVLIGVPDASLGEALVCYVELAQGTSATPEELREFVKKELDRTLVPKEICVRKKLDRISSGKIDRKTIKEKHIASAGAAAAPAAGAAPSTPSKRVSLTKHQKLVIDTVSEVIGKPAAEIGVEDNFFDIGGTSLQSYLIAEALMAETGVEMSAQTIYKHPTVSAIAAGLDAKGFVDEVKVDRGAILQKLLEDAKVPDLKLGGLPRAEVKATSKVLLTGATGFVGVHLLQELLANTSFTLCCIVRCKNPVDGLGRINKLAGSYGIVLDEEACKERVVVYNGDLGADMFGLPLDVYEGLCQSVDLVYHIGALVDFQRRYEDLKKVNVDGTRQVVLFAADTLVKPILYASTIAVWGISPHIASYTWDEARCNAPEEWFNGYMESKWVSEHLMLNAGEQGIPMGLFRISTVLGSPTTGAVPKYEFSAVYIKGCLEMGCLIDSPEIGYFYFVDVGSSAKVMFRASQQPIDGVTIYNCTERAPIGGKEIQAAIKDATGKDLTLEAFPVWFDRMMKGKDNPLLSYRAFLMDFGSTLPLLGKIHASRDIKVDNFQKLYPPEELDMHASLVATVNWTIQNLI